MADIACKIQTERRKVHLAVLFLSCLPPLPMQTDELGETAEVLDGEATKLELEASKLKVSSAFPSPVSWTSPCAGVCRCSNV